MARSSKGTAARNGRGHLVNARGIVLESFSEEVVACSSGDSISESSCAILRVWRAWQLRPFQRVQHVLFIVCLDLLPGERRATLASDSLQRDDVASPDSR